MNGKYCVNFVSFSWYQQHALFIRLQLSTSLMVCASLKKVEVVNSFSSHAHTHTHTHTDTNFPDKKQFQKTRHSPTCSQCLLDLKRIESLCCLLCEVTTGRFHNRMLIKPWLISVDLHHVIVLSLHCLCIILEKLTLKFY